MPLVVFNSSPDASARRVKQRLFFSQVFILNYLIDHADGFSPHFTEKIHKQVGTNKYLVTAPSLRFGQQCRQLSLSSKTDYQKQPAFVDVYLPFSRCSFHSRFSAFFKKAITLRIILLNVLFSAWSGQELGSAGV